jgi:hypothetical protein
LNTGTCDSRAAIDSCHRLSRTEVSDDAKRIVMHLWIIFVLLPVVLAVLWMVVK